MGQTNEGPTVDFKELENGPIDNMDDYVSFVQRMSEPVAKSSLVW